MQTYVHIHIFLNLTDFVQNQGLCHLLNMLNLCKIRRDNILYRRLFRIKQNNDTQSDSGNLAQFRLLEKNGLNGRIKSLSLRSQS